ncbi:MAG: 30S ribosomal protein S8 [Candidatus Nanoarchaeia archaeon]|nr:30S ribosomal protein S8 [Candidatus Nanoarchaeia archaeon]MDD5499791.1 30S ribosomal protein S8 [Candidatus Nanoarchaeia archaeon]
MRHDILADALSAITNAIKSRKSELTIGFKSDLIIKNLEVMKNEGYIGDYSEITEKKGIKIMLNGKLNKCNAIKPRFSVKKDGIEKFEKRYLPAKDFGCILISTNKGLMTHYEAKEKKLGGKLISYFY